MSTDVRLPPSSGDPVADRLAELAHETEDPGIERVARVALGMTAGPTTSDHVTTLYRADGWLVAQFEDDNGEVAMVRRCPPGSGFEQLAPEGDDLVRKNFGRFGVKNLFERFDVQWELFGEVEERFESAVDERRWGEGVDLDGE